MKYFFSVWILCLALCLQGCGGGGGAGAAGGSSSSSALSLSASSYENNLAAASAGFYSLSNVSTILGGSVNVLPHALTFADFFQDGSYSAAVVAQPTGGGSNSLYFLKKTGATWTDATATFSGLNRQVCAAVKQLLVADFNKDSKPDVYVVCGGGSSGPQYYFLSDPTSLSYTRYTTSINLNAESASIADVDGDASRIMDIVTTDSGSVTVLRGQLVSGALSFVQDNARVTTDSPVPNGIQTVVLIPRTQADATVKYDLVMGGSGSNGTSAVWLKNSGGYFGAVGRSFLLPTLGADGTYPHAELRDYMESGGQSFLYVMDHANALVKLYAFSAPTISLTGPTTSASPLAHTQQYDTSSVQPTAGWPSKLVKLGTSFYPLDAGCEVSGRCAAMFSLP